MSDNSDHATASDHDPTNSKVDRVIRDYDLEGMGERLEQWWTDDGDDQLSLRDLADRLNRELLRVAMERTGRSPLDREVETSYELLTDPNVSGGESTQKRRELEQAGINIEALEADFVSHQAIHTYLTKYRGVDQDSPSTTERRERERQRIQRLQSRLATVTDDSIERLANADALDIGTAEILVNVRILCPECGTDYNAIELIENGSCDCST